MSQAPLAHGSDTTHPGNLFLSMAAAALLSASLLFGAVPVPLSGASTFSAARPSGTVNVDRRYRNNARRRRREEHGRRLQVEMPYSSSLGERPPVLPVTHPFPMPRSSSLGERPPLRPSEMPAQHQPDGQAESIIGPATIINLFRRAKDSVSESDVPFLLQTPHSDSEVLHSIMTECYGLHGRTYDSVEDLVDARRQNITEYYVSSHDRPASAFKRFGERFHFLATPHYREGAALLTRGHKGRVILVLRHPVDVAEAAYRADVPEARTRGDVEDGLLRHVEAPAYVDNRLTRMLAGVPPGAEVTEAHFREARMMLENKFLIGMADDPLETVKRRLAPYFGWRELPEQRGCENRHIQAAQEGRAYSLLEERGHAWRAVRRREHFDNKLFARAKAVFGNQKMRIPVHVVRWQNDRERAKEAYEHLRNLRDERDASDLPFFWHIPKASGTTVKEILSDCYSLVRTEMVKPPSSLQVNKKNRILNMDLSTPRAIAAAKKAGLADLGLADVFISQLAPEGSTVFTPYHLGRAFTILRHPVKLATSLFYYRRIAHWEPSYRPEYQNITLQELVETEGYYDNWMVRMLTNSKLGGLNQDHLEFAKSVLKEKFIIGISDMMDETFRHLELYYGWSEQKEGCVQFHLHSAPSNKNKYPELEHGGPTWQLLADKNKFDMALYYYALELFGNQSMKLFREEKI